MSRLGNARCLIRPHGPVAVPHHPLREGDTSKACLSRARSSRATFHCESGLVFDDQPDGGPRRHRGSPRPTPQAAPESRPATPRRSTCRCPPARSPRWLGRSRSRRPPARRGGARDHCCDLLATWEITPLGMCHTFPPTSRRRVVRRLTPSTVPVAGPAPTGVGRRTALCDRRQDCHQNRPPRVWICRKPAGRGSVAPTKYWPDPGGGNRGPAARRHAREAADTPPSLARPCQSHPPPDEPRRPPSCET